MINNLLLCHRYYAGSEKKFAEWNFELTLRRKFLFYLINLIIPLVSHAFLTILVFYLPSASQEKVSLCINIMLSLIVYFLMLSETIPTVFSSRSPYGPISYLHNVTCHHFHHCYRRYPKYSFPVQCHSCNAWLDQESLSLFPSPSSYDAKTKNWKQSRCPSEEHQN